MPNDGGQVTIDSPGLQHGAQREFEQLVGAGAGDDHVEGSRPV